MPPEGYFAVLRSREDGKGLSEPEPVNDFETPTVSIY